MLGSVSTVLNSGRTNGDMPTYEYRCTQCGTEFERFQKMSDAPVEECPDCEGKVQRLISKGGGLLFKGTGFYATDYGSGRGSSETKESKSRTTKSESVGESGTIKSESAGESGSGTKKDKE